MSNIATVLKNEIARIARKEVKQQTQSLKKAAGGCRSEIATLKRRVHQLEAELRKVSRSSRRTPEATTSRPDESHRRFSAKGLASLRKRLGLSAADLGLLVGASALSVYKWEQGKARPREKYLMAIAGIRGVGKREADRRLLALR